MEGVKTSIEKNAGKLAFCAGPSEDCFTILSFRARTIVESELADLGRKSPVPEPSFREVGVPGVCLVRVPGDR